MIQSYRAWILLSLQLSVVQVGTPPKQLWKVALQILLLQALAQPLLDHALVVEVAGAGDAFDAGEHPGVETQGDRGRLAVVGSVHGGVHEARV